MHFEEVQPRPPLHQGLTAHTDAKGQTVRDELYIAYIGRVVGLNRMLPALWLIPASLAAPILTPLYAALWWGATLALIVVASMRLNALAGRHRMGNTRGGDLECAVLTALPTLSASLLIAAIFPTGTQTLDFALLLTLVASMTLMAGFGPPTRLCTAAAVCPPLAALCAGLLKGADLESLAVAAFVVMYACACFVLARSIRNDRRSQIENRERVAEALEEARAANLAKSKFLAAMSHELRTPLNAILGFSEVIVTQTLGPVGSVKYLEYAKDIHFSGNHLLNLINDVLDLAKIEAGKIEVERQALDPAALIEATVRMTAPRARTHEVSLRTVVAAQGVILYADERASTQALLNVVTNAIKFNRPGGEVVVELVIPDDGGVLFKVSDDGPGIPADQIERLFEPFEQGENSYNKGRNGTGLGLAIVRSLMKMHGGRVWIESDIGAGTTVFLHFPDSDALAVQGTPFAATAQQR